MSTKDPPGGEEQAASTIIAALKKQLDLPDPILQFFAFEHLPPHLAQVSQLFHELAQKVAVLPPSVETGVALRKLLESKDAAVRAMVAK